MPRRRKREPLQHTLEHNGKTFTWSVEDGCVTVRGNGGSKTTQIGGSSPLAVAHMLAFELAGGAK